ncbi:MAG TPA: histidine kinase [Gemmatimonadaceae bacterium]
MTHLRLSSVLRPFLAVPLQFKLLGANVIILGVAVLAFFGATWSTPTAFTDVFILVGALVVAGVVNFILVRLALSPVDELERVARRVAEGRLRERVAPSVVADPALAHLSATMNDMLEKLDAGRERMRRLAAEVVYAGERERAKVAKELHDSVGQTLAAASFQIAAVSNMIEPGPAASRLSDVRELLRTSLEEIRSVSRSLHPRVADDLGLPAALEALADATHQRSLVEVEVVVDTAGVAIPSALASTLYRVAQEALRNVERHVDAGRVVVCLTARPGLVQLEVSDDGYGLEGPLEVKRRENGLAAMRERLSLAGGELHIDSTAERGTRVTARIGLDTEAA